MKDIENEIRNQVQKLLLAQGDSLPFSNQDSLVMSRRLSSLQLIELATFLEKKYEINFAAVGFNPHDFDSVDHIMALLNKQQ